MWEVSNLSLMFLARWGTIIFPMDNDGIMDTAKRMKAIDNLRKDFVEDFSDVYAVAEKIVTELRPDAVEDRGILVDSVAQLIVILIQSRN